MANMNIVPKSLCVSVSNKVRKTVGFRTGAGLGGTPRP